MDATELLAAIDDIRDELAEAKRYVRRAPADCRNAVERAQEKLRILSNEHRLPLPSLTDQLIRAGRNLDWGLQALGVCPDALIGAIDLASFELAWARGSIEKKATAGEGRAE